jgi:hypothetical protein
LAAATENLTTQKRIGLRDDNGIPLCMPGRGPIPGNLAQSMSSWQKTFLGTARSIAPSASQFALSGHEGGAVFFSTYFYPSKDEYLSELT